jgi:hypothetical protein
VPQIGKDQQLTIAHTVLSSLIGSKFYGEWILKFEAGNIVHTKITRSLKIEDALSGTPKKTAKVQEKLLGTLKKRKRNGNDSTNQ